MKLELQFFGGRGAGNTLVTPNGKRNKENAFDPNNVPKQLNTVTVKSWVADNIESDMRQYHWSPVIEMQDIGSGVHKAIDDKDDTVTLYVRKILKQSEKALQVELDAETRVGNRGTEKGFRAWIPKSQIKDYNRKNNYMIEEKEGEYRSHHLGAENEKAAVKDFEKKNKGYTVKWDEKKHSYVKVKK